MTFTFNRLTLLGILSSVLLATVVNASSYSVCFEEWNPYAYVDEEGEWRGTSVDTIRQALRVKSIDVEFHQMPHSRCTALVKNKEIDFALHVDESDSLFLIQYPVADWALTFVTKQDNTKTYQELITAEKSNILISRDYVYPKQLLSKLAKTPVKITKTSFNTESPEEIKRFFAILLSGRVDGILIDKTWADLMIERYEFAAQTYEQIFHHELQFIGYHADRKYKASILEKAIKGLKQ